MLAIYGLPLFLLVFLEISVQTKSFFELNEDRIFFSQMFKLVLVSIGYLFRLKFLKDTYDLNRIVI